MTGKEEDREAEDARPGESGSDECEEEGDGEGGEASARNADCCGRCTNAGVGNAPTAAAKAALLGITTRTLNRRTNSTCGLGEGAVAKAGASWW